VGCAEPSRRGAYSVSSHGGRARLFRLRHSTVISGKTVLERGRSRTRRAPTGAPTIVKKRVFAGAFESFTAHHASLTGGGSRRAEPGSAAASRRCAPSGRRAVRASTVPPACGHAATRQETVGHPLKQPAPPRFTDRRRPPARRSRAPGAASRRCAPSGPTAVLRALSRRPTGLQRRVRKPWAPGRGTTTRDAASEGLMSLVSLWRRSPRGGTTRSIEH
jgi:hypothetical protein